MDDVEINAGIAANLIQTVGVDRVEMHPAQDHFTLNDGRVIVLDEGGYDHDRSWWLRGLADLEGAAAPVTIGENLNPEPSASACQDESRPASASLLSPAQ